MGKERLLEKLQENNLTHWKKAPEGYWNGQGLNKLESCAYYAVLASLSEEELSEAMHTVKEWPHSSDIVERIEKTLNPVPYNLTKKNENIATLLKRFLDKKSKRVVESRKELKRRFEYLDFKDQKKIIKAFLVSPNEDDREWAAVQADKRWDDSFISSFQKAYELSHSLSVIITIVRHLPLEYVKSIQEEVEIRAAGELCKRMGNEPGFDIYKYDLYIFEYLYIMVHLKKELPESEAEIEKRVFMFLYEWIVRTLKGNTLGFNCKFEDFPELRKMVWALGQLKMPNIVLKILQCEAYIQAHINENSYVESLSLAKEWIEEVWEYEGKEDMLNHLILINGWNLVDYRECDDLPPDFIDFMDADSFSDF